MHAAPCCAAWDVQAAVCFCCQDRSRVRPIRYRELRSGDGDGGDDGMNDIADESETDDEDDYGIVRNIDANESVPKKPSGADDGRAPAPAGGAPVRTYRIDDDDDELLPR